MRRIVPALLLLIVTASPASAGEFFLSGGYLASFNPSHQEKAWQLSFIQQLSEHLALRLAYLNEGHLPRHHRDSHSASVWFRSRPLKRRLRLAAGAGALYYYDTTGTTGKDLNRDVHGLGLISSLAATWYTKSGVLFQLNANWVNTDSFDTVTALLGIGYQLDPLRTSGQLSEALPEEKESAKNELTLFAGRTVVNVSGPGKSTAAAFEYRRRLWHHLDWTAGVLYEGESSPIHRFGLTSQLWLTDTYLQNRVTLGIGAGGYVNQDRHRKNREDEISVGPIVTLTTSYRINSHYLGRISWDRIITDYDRDSDVFLGGVGYRF